MNAHKSSIQESTKESINRFQSIAIEATGQNPKTKVENFPKK